MKAAAYGYAVGGGPKPGELRLLENIDRFGVRAVMGRDVLAYGEIVRMRYAENLPRIYEQRQRAENWAQWVKDNPDLARLLNEAERLYNGE